MDTCRTNAARACAESARAAVRIVAAMPGAALVLAVAFALAGCANRWSDFDRIAPSPGFDEVRETAAWCEDFDPAWWPAIETASAAHEARLAEIERDAWRPFAESMARLRVQNKRVERGESMAQWRESRAVDARLAASERAFGGELRAALPPRAEPFVALLEARMAFWRATARWSDGWSRMPGPLEALAPPGAVVADDAVVRAATDAYLRLAPLAARAADARAAAYFDYLDEANALGDGIAAREIEMRAPGLDDAARKSRAAEADRMRKSRDALGRRLDEVVYREIDDRLRVALRAEGRLVAEAVADEARRARVVGRLDGALLGFAPSRRLVEAAGEIGRRALERRTPREPALEAEFDALMDGVRAEHARLLEALDAPSMSVRRDAYGDLPGVFKPIESFFKQHDPTALEVGLDGLAAVADGARTPDEALDARGRADANEEDESDAAPDFDDDDDPLLIQRPKELRLLAGLPLDARVIRRLEADLGLPIGVPAGSRAAAEASDARTPFAEAVLAAQIAAVAETATDLERLAALGPGLKELGTMPDPRRAAKDLFREGRTILARIEGADRRANERVLAEAARLAGVGLDDPRIELAARRLELRRLLPERAIDPGAEPVLGLGRLATVDPMEVLESCGLDEAERALAEAAIVDRGDELVEAARRARETMLANLEALLLEAAESYASGADGTTLPAWRGRASGAEPAAMRIAIADDLGVLAGEGLRAAMLEALARRAAPGLLPRLSRAHAALRRFASGAGLDGDARAASEPARLAVEALLEQGARERTGILHDALLWRGAFAPAEAIEGEGAWERCARSAPEAWHWRQRLLDADARTVARCASLLAAFPGFELPADLRAALTTFPRRPLVPMPPFLGEVDVAAAGKQASDAALKGNAMNIGQTSTAAKTSKGGKFSKDGRNWKDGDTSKDAGGGAPPAGKKPA